MEIGYSNEWSRLESVAIHIPRRNAIATSNPEKVMYQSIPNYDKLLEEVDSYRTLLKILGITVYDDVECSAADLNPFLNQLYMRDLAVICPDKIILANPKYEIRKGEQHVLKQMLRANGYVGSFITLKDDVTMEGADFFWINESEVTISVGNRTSESFADLFAQIYPNIKVNIVRAHEEGVPQHILGAKHIINENTLLSRDSINNDDLNFTNIIKLSETDEITKGYSMNVVTIDRNEVIMPEGNPETKEIYEKHGITVHTTPCYEMYKLGGALACLTLPIKRL